MPSARSRRRLGLVRSLAGGTLVALWVVGCRDPGGFGRHESTRRYVIAAIDVAPVTPDGHAAGFDLDDTVSEGTGAHPCDAADFTSPTTLAPGVDNQFAAHVLPALEPMLGPDGIAPAFAAEIVAGRSLVIVELTSSGLAHDTRATARVFVARRPSSGVLTTPDGSIAPGQTFDVAFELGIFAAPIDGERVAFTVPVLPVGLRVGDRSVVLALNDVRVEARLDAETLHDGELGGALLLADFATLSAALGLPADEAALRALAAPDLEADAGGACQAISVGASFEAVHAAGPEG